MGLPLLSASSLHAEGENELGVRKPQLSCLFQEV